MVKKISKKHIRNVIIVGKPGAGKGVRAEILSSELKLKHLSTGDIFKEILTKKTPLATKVRKYYEAGHLVPDKIVNEVFAEYFKKHDYKGCILDGFPRNVSQAKFFMKLLEKKGSGVDMIILSHREDKDIVEHIIHRHDCLDCNKIYHMQDNPPKKTGVCDICGGKVTQRSDVHKIKMRLDVFRKEIEPMIDWLKKHDVHFIMVPGKVDPYSQKAIRESVMKELRRVLN